METLQREELDLLRESAAQFLAARHPLESVAAIADSDEGWHPDEWRRLADLDWLDRDLGLAEHAILLEETAAVLLPAPLFSTLAMAWAAVASDPELAQRVSNGAASASLAWWESGGPQSLLHVGWHRTVVDDQGRVTGRKELVTDATWVDTFVVLARGPGGATLVKVDAADTVIRPRSTSDRTRRLADVEFHAAPSRPVAQPDSVVELLAATERRAHVLAAAEALGIARQALALGVGHASERMQFGRLIGTYQAVAHPLVDAFTQLELARSLTYRAIEKVAGAEAQADVFSLAAKTTATAAASKACETAIQVLGGMGMTWEHPIHRLYKRAQWLETFITDDRTSYRRIADVIL